MPFHSRLRMGRAFSRVTGAERTNSLRRFLAESNTPLHYTEIAERARIREGRSLDARRAHNAAANVGYLFARGTYGLARHVPLSDEQMSQISQ